MRNWINTAHHAEKLALSNDFYEIKSLTEKIGTNRRLLSRKTEFEFVRPFDLIPKYLPAVAEKAQEGRAFCEARPAEGGASEQQNNPDFKKSLSWSGRWELNPVNMLLHPAPFICCVGPPRFELGLKRPKRLVLPLHHGPKLSFCPPGRSRTLIRALEGRCSIR